MAMEIAKVRNYEVWIEGTLGIHKGKPLLYSVYNDYRTAQVAMQRLLKSGRFATLITKESG